MNSGIITMIYESSGLVYKVTEFCVPTVLREYEFICYETCLKGDTVISDSKLFDMNLFNHSLLF